MMAWPLWLSVCLLTLVSLLLTIVGGLVAVVVTDSFQSILMIVGCATLTILGFQEIGSLDILLKNTPDDYWKLFRPINDDVYPWHAIVLGYPVLAIWFWCIDQTIVQRALGAKNLQQAQKGLFSQDF